MMTRYPGTPKASMNSRGVGTLEIYDNRLIYHLLLDKAEYSFDEIASVDMGKYLGVYSSIQIFLHDGSVWSFVPAIPGDGGVSEAVGLIRRFL